MIWSHLFFRSGAKGILLVYLKKKFYFITFFHKKDEYCSLSNWIYNVVFMMKISKVKEFYL